MVTKNKDLCKHDKPHQMAPHYNGPAWGERCSYCGFERPSKLALAVRAGRPEEYGPLNREVAESAEDLIGDLRRLMREIERTIEKFESTDNPPEDAKHWTTDRYEELAWLDGKITGRISRAGGMLNGTVTEEVAQFAALLKAAKKVTNSLEREKFEKRWKSTRLA